MKKWMKDVGVGGLTAAVVAGAGGFIGYVATSSAQTVELAAVKRDVAQNQADVRAMAADVAKIREDAAWVRGFLERPR